MKKEYEKIVKENMGEIEKKLDGEERIRGEVVMIVGKKKGEEVEKREEDIERIIMQIVEEMKN